MNVTKKELELCLVSAQKQIADQNLQIEALNVEIAGLKETAQKVAPKLPGGDFGGEVALQNWLEEIKFSKGVSAKTKGLLNFTRKPDGSGTLKVAVGAKYPRWDDLLKELALVLKAGERGFNIQGDVHGTNLYFHKK